MRDSGPWAIEKLDYVKRYIDAFATSMHRKKWRKRIFIDLFAGPGKCSIQKTKQVCLGSPLLALGTRCAFTDYFFVDLEAKNIDALKKRCGVNRTGSGLEFFVGDSNVVVDTIVSEIEEIDRQRMPRQWSSRNLAFLDPEGLELSWSTVETLARPYRMDLIILYPEGGLNRCMPDLVDTVQENVVDRFFGSDDWRRLYEQHGNDHRVFMDFYRDNLQRLGFQEPLPGENIYGDEPVMRNSRKAPQYRLLFASKHRLGQEFWHSIVQRNVHGQGILPGISSFGTFVL